MANFLLKLRKILAWLRATPKIILDMARERVDLGPYKLRNSASIPDSENGPLTDEELMERISHRDTTALGVIFDRFYKIVLNITWRVLRDRADAKDLTQDIFLQIFHHAHRFDSSQDTAKSAIVQYSFQRSYNRRMSMILRRQYDPETIAKLEEEQLEPRFSLKGIEGLPLKETKIVMQRAIALLTEKERTVLTLCYFQGFEYEEVAARLGETVESVRHLFYQATKKVMNAAIELADEMKLPMPLDS